MENYSILSRWAAFVGGILITLFCIYVVAPFVRSHVESIDTMATFVDNTGIETGEFYYTDVEIVAHADLSARSSIEYTPKGPAILSREEK